VSGKKKTNYPNQRYGNALLEQSASHELKTTLGFKEVFKSFSVRIHNFRHKLLDWRNSYDKPYIDALTKVGLFTDDRPEFCQGIEEAQFRIPIDREEETIIIIEEEDEIPESKYNSLDYLDILEFTLRSLHDDSKNPSTE